MFNLRDIIIFFAGAEFFHTISHMLIPYFFQLPLTTNVLIITTEVNIWTTVINAIITVALLWWACRLGKKKSIN